MGTFWRSCAKKSPLVTMGREPTELQFGAVSGVTLGIGVLDGCAQCTSPNGRGGLGGLGAIVFNCVLGLLLRCVL